ncbi:MAG: penicillin-binding protein 2 [Micropruina sp.]|nr:MAG: penicillin-binding protein 2 [Micropruina sp.]
MNRPIRAVAVVALLMSFALLANLSFNYLARQDSLNAQSGNRRVQDANFAQDRGAILVGNKAVAETVAVKDRFKFQRKYSDGKLYAPITGFYSYQYGATGLEQGYSQELAGNDSSQLIGRLVNLATGTKPKGASVQTTIDAGAQKAAAQALGGLKGAVVALNPKTGAILAMVTSPSFDPNAIATHDLADATAAWNTLRDDKSKPLANRATREIFPPGSTFKTVVAAAALEAGYEPDTLVRADSVKLPGTNVTIPGSCGGTKITLTQALAVSCNPAFARLGMELGADALREQAEKFGFGTRFLPDLGNSAASRFPEDPDKPQTAMSAIGEFEVAATPLQMAMVAGAVANGGVVMQPYVVESVRSADLQVLSQTRPQQSSVAMSSTNAFKLRQMMLEVVQNGTGRRAQITGVTIGGKTGTAHSDNVRAPYAWFIAFADDPSVAVCVFVQDAEMETSDIAGGRVAAPIARAVIEALR